MYGDTTGAAGTSEVIAAFDRGGRTAALKKIIELVEKGDGDPGILADRYAELGDRDQAFKYLDIAVERHLNYAVRLKRDRSLDSLHSDPRWTALLKRVGLPQ